MEVQSFQENYSKPKFWNKININWKSAGKRVVEIGVELYMSLQDKDTPAWAKGIILSALGYFISPIDALPDFIPMVGFTDDLGVMLSALAVVAIHVKDEHKSRAKEISAKIFGD